MPYCKAGECTHSAEICRNHCYADRSEVLAAFNAKTAAVPIKEYTGSSVNYYKVRITAPVSGNGTYTAECNDIIEALHMNFAEGNAFKAIWRSCAARNLGLSKQGYKDGKYDAEKVVFFGQRMVTQAMQPTR